MNALLTDLYELNMAASYLRRGMTEPATFSLFVRHMPESRGFLVAAGIESCLDLLEGFQFEVADIQYLHEALGFALRDLEAFRQIRFTGDVWAIPEGRVALAGEPLVEVTAPLPEAQLVETLMLNQVTFETAIASKAARCVIAGAGRDLVDFAFRRTQGLEAGLDVARLSAITGFVATSNVEAARRYGLMAAGTMAHSYVEAFPSEVDAFRAFAQDFPARTTFLVDTYDTVAGIKDAIAVIKELGLGGQLGIRLDSGDLCALAKRGRRLLDQEGLQQVRIFASGGLDEFEIDELVHSGAQIDAFGVGTKMGVSADYPYLDTAYKLVCYAGRSVMKLSRGKVTAPGRKQLFRRRRPFGDLIGLFEEVAPSGREPVLEPLMLNGRRTGTPSQLPDSRQRFNRDLADLPGGARLIRSPRAPKAQMTPALRQLMATTRVEMQTRLRASSTENC